MKRKITICKDNFFIYCENESMIKSVFKIKIVECGNPKDVSERKI